MAFIIKDRVKENTTSTGTGAVSLGGAAATFDTFQSYMSNGDTTYYAIVHTSSGVDEWEVGIGTWNTGNTLTRTTVLAGSNGTSAENFSAGTKDVFMTYPASKALFMDSAGDVAFSGDIDVAGSAEIETHIDLKTTTSNKPSHSEGRIFYDAAFGALAVYNDESDITLQVGQEEYIRVKNDTGATITNGTPVYLTGEDASTPTIAKAVADGTYAQSQAVGIATHDIEANTTGYITVRGLIADVDTSHLTVGEKVHVDVGGGTTTSAPSYPYFATDVGICLISSASGGCIYVYVETHAFESIRVTENAHFDSNVTIDGDLTVLGTQTIANSENISLSGAFNYFNSGDTIGDANTSFTGTGLDDATLTGHYEGTTTNKTFKVKITTAGTPDKFRWSTDNFTTQSAEINIDGTDQTLEDGISVQFNATTGHTVGDIWSGSVSPVNVDSGIASNRNTGGSGVGYTHMGLYYDVSTNKWTFFDEYDPEPEGTIDTTDSSFSLATVKAGAFEGDLDGDVSGDVTGNVTGNVTGSLTGDIYANNGTSKILENGTDGTDATFTGTADKADMLSSARTISLTGDVTGSVSFDGSDNASITAVVQDNSHSHTIANVTNLQSTLNGKAATSTTITAGNGLTGGGNLTANRTLNVGAGTGVTVGADSISIGQAVGTTDDVTFGDVTADVVIAEGGSFTSGIDTNTTSAVVIEKGDQILSDDGNYLRNMLMHTTGGVIEVGQGSTALITGINLKPGNSGQAQVNGVQIITDAGSGLTKSGDELAHADTSTQASVNNSGGTVIQDITLDTYGHITGISSANLDGRYYTETEADSRFVNVTGDTMTGNLVISKNAPVIQLTETDQSNKNWYIVADGSQFSVRVDSLGSSNYPIQITSAGQLRSENNRVFHDGYHPNADKWTTARTHTVTLTGEVTGTASQTVDGSGNKTWSLATTLNHSALNDQYVNKTGDTMTGALKIDTDNQINGALRIENNVTDTNNDFYFAQEIIQNLTGSQTATADREQGGIYMDINSTNTGGDTTNEHRAYGIYIDLDVTGDADVAQGVYSNVTVTPTTGTVSNAIAGYFFAEDNGGAGSTSGIYGIQSYAYSDNATSDTETLRAGHFQSVITADSGNVSTVQGIVAEVQADTTADTLGTTRVFEAQYDNNSGIAQTNTTTLFYGNYAGTLPTTAWGVYIDDAVDNYFAGSLQIGDRIKHIGDTDTYMQFHNNDQWRVVTGGEERLEVTNSQIKTPEPIEANQFISTSSALLQKHVTAWSSAPRHDVIYNGWTSATGDYITLKSAGNSTTAHGVLGVADNGIYFGRTNVETGAAQMGSSLTAPFDHSTWGYVNATAFYHGGDRVFDEGFHPNADKWTTARSHTVTLTGDVTGTATQSVDGTGNKTWSISTTVGNNSHEHTRLQERSTITYGQGMLQWTDQSSNGGTGLNGSSPTNPTGDWYHHLVMNHANSGGYYVDLAACFHHDGLYMRRLTNGSLGSWNRFFADNYHPNADKWTTARTLSLSGDASGSVSWDGSANATLSVTVANDSHTHDGRYYTESEADSRFVNVTGDTMTGRLVLPDGGYSIGDEYHTWKRDYVVNNTSPKELLYHDGNSLPSGGAYRFHAHISGTGTDQSATAVYWNQNGTWKVNVTYQSGTSSNHPEFIIGGSPEKPQIHIDHSSNYTIHVLAERLELAEGTGTDNLAGFGADAFLGSVGGTLRYNNAGSANTYANGNIVFHDGYHPNADKWTTARTLSLSGDASGSVSWDGSANATLTVDVGNAQTVDGYNAPQIYNGSHSYLAGYYQNGSTGQKPNHSHLGAGKMKLTMQSSSNLGFGGSWNDVLWMSSYTGGDVKKSTALVSSKYDNTSLYIAKQNYDSASWGTGYLIWNSGNDGSGSGLDADLLDGYHESTFMRRSANSHLDMNGYNINDCDSFHTQAESKDVKFAVYSGSTYGIGMTSGITYGALNDWAMTFCMNNDTDRGFWWGYSGQTKSTGAMSLTTNGRLTVSNYVSSPNMYIDGNIYHNGDTNTYIGFHAADQFRVVTGGAERLEVNNSRTQIDNLLVTGYCKLDSNTPFYENEDVVASNYTITNGLNAMSAGPITINSGITVTIGDGEAWTVV